MTARAEECEAFVVPADPFAALLDGLDLTQLPAGALTLARSLSIMERQFGLPARRFDVRLDQVDRVFDSGDSEGALQAVEVVLELQPDDPRALYLQGAILRRLGRHDESMASFLRIVALQPDSARGHTMLGQQAFKARRFEQAEGHLGLAVEVDPAYALARYLLGRVHLAQGRLDEAEVQLGAARAFAEPLSFPDVSDLLEQIAVTREAASGRSARSDGRIPGTSYDVGEG
jgi:tetratricopeptide (TPR) repeat protein